MKLVLSIILMQSQNVVKPNLITSVLFYGLIIGVGYLIYRKIKKKGHTKIKRLKKEKDQETV